jgi:nitrous oxidase accessory protein NosD
MSHRRVSRRALLYATPLAAGAAAMAPGSAAAAATTGPMISPKDPPYGAAGDGVTDDTAAINACLAANRAVDFGGPENTYLITGTLLVAQPSRQALTASGASLKAGAAVNLMRFRNAGHTVTGLVLDGNGQAGGVGLIVEASASNSLVDGCDFLNMGASAVHIGAHYATVRGCTMRHCGVTADVPLGCTIFVSDADFCSILDNRLLECNWGVYFRGSAASPGINGYNCRGNVITCASPAPPAAQGISNRYGRMGRIDGNIITGFADNSIDCWGCSQLTITGNSTLGGKNGVFTGDGPTSNITITGNSFRQPQQSGVRVDSSTDNALVIGVVIAANSVIQPAQGGILVSEGGTAQVSGVNVTDNDVHLAGSGTYGIRMVNAEVSKISGNRIFRPTREAIYLDGVDLVEVVGNTLQDASYTNANVYNALHITNSNRVLVRDNVVYGSAKAAVAITGGTGMTVTGTRWRALTAGGISDQATGTVKSDNVQF